MLVVGRSWVILFRNWRVFRPSPSSLSVVFLLRDALEPRDSAESDSLRLMSVVANSQNMTITQGGRANQMGISWLRKYRIYNVSPDVNWNLDKSGWTTTIYKNLSQKLKHRERNGMLSSVHNRLIWAPFLYTISLSSQLASQPDKQKSNKSCFPSPVEQSIFADHLEMKNTNTK